MLTIGVPERINPRNLSRFKRAISDVKNSTAINIDFGPDRDFSPASILMVFRIISDLLKSRNADNIIFSNYRNHKYAAHLGLFRLLGLNFGRYPHLNPTTPNYLPIQSIKTDDWIKDIAFTGLSEHIDLKCRNISRILCQGIGKDESELVHFNLRELIRNIFEHANATEMLFTAQYWPKLRKTSIALCDNGVGLLETLSNNRFIEVNTEASAIKAALLPGISGSKRLKSGDMWDNSGYGLYMTSEIGRRYGQFYISSGQAAREIRGNDIIDTVGTTSGTFISLDFTLNDKVDLEPLLSQIALDGERKARSKFGFEAKTASRSSKGS